MKCLSGDVFFRVQCCTNKRQQQRSTSSILWTLKFHPSGMVVHTWNYILGNYPFYEKRTHVIIYKEYFGLTLVYSSSRSTELNLASTSVDVRTTNCSMPVSWKHPTTNTKVCKNSGYICLHYVSCLQRQDITYLLVKFTCMV